MPSSPGASRARPADASGYWWSLPIVAETWDGASERHQWFPRAAGARLSRARHGRLRSGGRGQRRRRHRHDLSRIQVRHRHGVAPGQRLADSAYTLGVLVQANYGLRDTLRIAGVPIGQHIRNDRIYTRRETRAAGDGFDHHRDRHRRAAAAASAATHRAPGRARPRAHGQHRRQRFRRHLHRLLDRECGGAAGAARSRSPTSIGNDHLDPLFGATVQGTEEAIVNAMVAARDMQGNDGTYAKALPHAELVRLLEQYGRPVKGAQRR